MVVRVRCLFSLSHSLSSPCLSPPPLPSLCNNLLQPADGGRDKLSGGRGWYRHPLLSLLILSDHLPSTIALATPFCEETRRDSSRPTSPSRSLSFSFSPRTSIAEIRISTIYRDPLFLLLSRRRTVFHRLSSAEMEISLPWRGSCIPRASNRSIYRSLKNSSSFRDARLDKYSSGSR